MRERCASLCLLFSRDVCLVIHLLQLLLEHLNFLTQLSSISFFGRRAHRNFRVQVRCLVLEVQIVGPIARISTLGRDFVDLRRGLLLDVLVWSARMT